MLPLNWPLNPRQCLCTAESTVGLVFSQNSLTIENIMPPLEILWAVPLVWSPYQKGRGVEGCNGDGIKDLRLLQGLQLLFSVAQNLLQEGLFPGIELQDLYSVQDLIHQSDAVVHELHLNLLLTRQRGFWGFVFQDIPPLTETRTQKWLLDQSKYMPLWQHGLCLLSVRA